MYAVHQRSRSVDLSSINRKDSTIRRRTLSDPRNVSIDPNTEIAIFNRRLRNSMSDASSIGVPVSYQNQLINQSSMISG